MFKSSMDELVAGKVLEFCYIPGLDDLKDFAIEHGKALQEVASLSEGKVDIFT